MGEKDFTPNFDTPNQPTSKEQDREQRQELINRLNELSLKYTRLVVKREEERTPEEKEQINRLAGEIDEIQERLYGHNSF